MYITIDKKTGDIEIEIKGQIFRGKMTSDELKKIHDSQSLKEMHTQNGETIYTNHPNKL